MKNYRYQSAFDAKVSQNIIEVICHLYDHQNRDILPDLQEKCGLNDVVLLEKKSADLDKLGKISLLKRYFSKRPPVDLQYIASTLVDVDSKQKTVFITFKGSKEGVDWLTDFAIGKAKFFGTEYRVHSGFHRSIELFEESFKIHCTNEVDGFYHQLYETLQEEGTKVVLTGHSLGGALATLAACRFSDLGVAKENLVVYSFGAPPIASKAFVEAYQERFTIHRFSNALDIVTLVDKLLYVFKKHRLLHLGEEIELPSNEGEIHSILGYKDNMKEYIDTVSEQHKH